MARRPTERALDRIIPRLKERTVHSEKFIMNEAMEPVNRKMNDIMHHAMSMSKRKGSHLSLILNDLDKMHMTLEYFMHAVARATKDYNTYIFTLETLYDEYSGGSNRTGRTSKEPRERKVSSDYDKLISREMYDKIFLGLKEKGVALFNTASGDRIGVSKSSLSRFIRVGLKRGDIRKIGDDHYTLDSGAKQDVVSVSRTV